MKLNCGPTYAEKYAAKKEWHRFFCLFPRRMTGTHDCRWLEVVERKGSERICGWDVELEWEYRAIK